MSAIVALRPAPLAEAERLAEEIAELCAYLHVAKAHLLALIHEFDLNRCWAQLGFGSCVQWLNFHCGLGPAAAREHLRVAHALVELPKIAAAFEEGRLSYSKVRAMTRVANADNEDFLMMVAKHGNASHIERLVSQYRRVEKLQRPDAADELFQQRTVTYHYDDDGCFVLKAKMPADRGELIVKALERAIDDEWRLAGNSGRQLAGNSGRRLAGDWQDRPIAARRADALADIAETYLNHPDNAGSTADRYQVVVHTNRDSATLENGPHVSAETSQRIQCDCCTTTIEEDEFGEPLNIGRRSRTIPPAMRRALKSRDGGCRFPGCTSHKFCDGHHIRHWSDGGETSLDNLVLLCRYHHHLVHEGGFDCRKGAGGEVYFTDQREQRLKAFHETPRLSIEETLAWLYRKFEDRDVSAETSKAQWYAGETMDMEYAVWVMCNACKRE